MRPWARATEQVRMKRTAKSRVRRMQSSLLVAESLYGVEAGGANRGIETGDEADGDREYDRADYQPPGHEPDLLGREFLAFQIDIGADVDHAADGPAQAHTQGATQQTHHPSFPEEQAPNVEVAGPDGLHNADFAAALKDGHHQG